MFQVRAANARGLGLAAPALPLGLQLGTENEVQIQLPERGPTCPPDSVAETAAGKVLMEGIEQAAN